MENELPREEISRYRKQVCQLLAKLKFLAFKAGYRDRLFQGVPCEVMRTCGKKNCRCMQGGQRHGPYKVVQVWRENCSRQLSLKKGEEQYFEMAKRYQFQQQNRRQVAQLLQEILAAVDAMLERRTIWNKK
jgi:hypothetical protein